MPLSLDFKKFSPLLEEATLILTPNSRTKKAVLNGQLVSLSAGSIVKPLKTFSLSHWLESLWSELSFYQVLPKKISNLVFKSWLEKQINLEQEWTLTNPSGVANKAIEAYKNLVHWDLDLNQLKASGMLDSIEVDYFIKWMVAFEKFTKEKQLIAEFCCLNLLIKNLDQLDKTLPKHILMVGFDHLTPLENKFIECLRQQNVKIDRFEFEANSKSDTHCHRQKRFSSFREEINFAASYAKEFFNYHEKSDHSSGVLGIVVDQLATNLAEVHVAFSREFHPQESKPWIAIDKPSYNVSAGFSLAEQPLVVAALTLLKIKSYRLSREEVHFIKNTPFIKWNSVAQNPNCETKIRQFLHELCLSQRQHFSMKYLLERIAQDDSNELLKPLKDILEHLYLSESAKNSKNCSIHQHIDLWKTRLALWSWVGLNDKEGQSHLNEFELKAKSNFFDALENTLEVAHVSAQLNEQDAYSFLSQQVTNKPFQIASDHSSVQILGILEASGLQFDELLVVGFNAQNWPRKNKINPFLPLAFQRQYDMPGNSAQREYEYAGRLSSSLLNASVNTIVTSNNESTNQDQNEAVCFSNLSILSDKDRVAKFVVTSKSEELADSEEKYDWIDDSSIDLSDQTLYGGAYLLSEYANCPFRSMANFQLRLTGYPVQEPGIESKAKGSWLHDSMEIIWSQIKTQEALLLLDDEQLKDLIWQALARALEKHKDFFSATTQQQLVKIEQQKLAKLIDEWLALEKERKNFRIVALEKEYKIQIASLSLKFRVDRIDALQLVGGDSSSNTAPMATQLSVIDYKTGAVAVDHWFGVRPTEAQMPAYILALENEHQSQTCETIESLNYAQIKTGSVSIQGLSFLSQELSGQAQKQLSKHEHSLQKSKDLALPDIGVNSYDSLLKDWNSTLDRISQGITTGWTPVSPKNKESCSFCDFRSVCRIDETQPDDFESEYSTVGSVPLEVLRSE